MACHFARWSPASTVLDTRRLSAEVIAATAAFSIKRRQRFLQGRILLAELMFYLYGLPLLPPIATTPTGRPCFADHHLPDFSLAYAANTVGVLLSAEGKVGLDIEVMRARRASECAAAPAPNAGGNRLDRRAGRSAGGGNPAVEHPSKRVENFRAGQQWPVDAAFAPVLRPSALQRHPRSAGDERCR